MAKKNKFYVVWSGRETGVFSSWVECDKQIKGFQGAKFKGYPDLESANEAYDKGYEWYKQQSQGNSSGTLFQPSKEALAAVIHNSLSVDAACSGNPGVMEYRGVWTGSGTEVFRKKFNLGTNNIGEFLAIVHGLAFLKQQKLNIPIYTDSKIAMAWVKAKKCRTKLPLTTKVKALFEVVQRGEAWLKSNTYQQKILKWDTNVLGEIPADFGRK